MTIKRISASVMVGNNEMDKSNKIMENNDHLSFDLVNLWLWKFCVGKLMM